MRGRWREPGTRRGAVVVAVVALAAVGLVSLHVRAYPDISPIDELQHIDYLAKAAHGELVGRGERVSELAMREEACRGIDAPVPIPRCGASELRPGQFQENGFNTAYVHPPTYYAISGLIARTTRAFTGLESLVTAARLTGALWLAAAALLLWVALGDLGTDIRARAVLLVVMATAPTVLHASATVNPDAMALAVGAALLLGVLRWESGRWPLWVPAALSAVAVLVKSTNVVAVGAALLYCLVRHVQARSAGRAVEVPVQGGGRSAHPSLLVRVLAAMLGSVVVVSLGWIVAQAWLAERPADEIPMLQRYEADSISVSDVTDQIGASISPLREPYLPPVLRTDQIVSSVAVVDAMLVAGVVIGIVFARPGARQRALGVASLATMVAVGPLFVVVNFVFSGTFVEIPARYGLSVVPFALAAATVALERRPLLAGAGLYAGWLVLITPVPLLAV